MELLDVFVYGKNTLHIGAGEIVRIKGKFNIQPNFGVRNKRLFTVLHANFTGEDPDSVIYEQRQTLTITNGDIESFYKFVKFPNVIDRLASMVAPNVIGHTDKKVGILRSVVGGVEQSRRGRINTLFVGEIGTAKSTLARQATKILPKSRYVTAYNASAKSLLAIIEKDTETTTLRLGAIPLSKNAICSIDELQSMFYEEQGFLLNIMEEGCFTLDKYARHKEIDSPTTIIATANPHHIQWDNSFKISKGEIQITKPLLDRFDQLYAFSDFMSEEEAQEYAENKTKIEARKPHNYKYLTKYVLYARKIQPLFTPEARINA